VTGIAFSLICLAVALYFGLEKIADAIKFRRVDVNVGKLPDLNVRYGEPDAAERDSSKEKP
jgi:hypothetical protein